MFTLQVITLFIYLVERPIGQGALVRVQRRPLSSVAPEAARVLFEHRNGRRDAAGTHEHDEVKGLEAKHRKDGLLVLVSSINKYSIQCIINICPLQYKHVP